MKGSGFTLRSYFLDPLLSHRGFLELRRFPAFDGLRALAAAMVIAFHFGGPKFAFVSGWLGVQLFFVLSGFLITTLLLREEALGGRISLGNFWIRRLLRILPLYYLVFFIILAVGVLRTGAIQSVLSNSLWWFLAVSPDLAPTDMGFPPAWTIGIEQKFYIVWPLIGFVLIVGRVGRRVVVWVSALALTLALSFLVWSSMVHYAVILFGSGMAIAMHYGRSFSFARFLTARATSIAAIALLIAVQLNASAIQQYFQSQTQLVLLYGLCAALAVPGLCALTLQAKALALGPLRWLGDRSYAIYLLQVVALIVITAVFPGIQGLRYLILVSAVVIILADVAHRWVELPSIEWGRSLVRRRSLRRSGRAARVSLLGGQPEGGLPRGEA